MVSASCSPPAGRGSASAILQQPPITFTSGILNTIDISIALPATGFTSTINSSPPTPFSSCIVILVKHGAPFVSEIRNVYVDWDVNPPTPTRTEISLETYSTSYSFSTSTKCVE